MTKLRMPRLAIFGKAASIKKLTLLLAVIAGAGAWTSSAHALNVRTFVSGTGTDTSNTQCSATAPCLTFAHAIAETSSGGEIDCLDPGDFGPVTITIAVTINCEGASNGGVETSGANAINITSATGPVNLIGLDINGENVIGGIGINITSNAAVNIRNCKVYAFPQGSGIYFAPSTSGGVLVVDNALIANNTFGISQASINGSSNMTVRNSNINNNQGDGIVVNLNGGTHAGASIEQTMLAFNGFNGLLVEGGAIAVLGGSTIVNNATGVATLSGGSVYSFKNNQIGGNSTDGTPLTAYPGGPLN